MVFSETIPYNFLLVFQISELSYLIEDYLKINTFWKSDML